MSFTSVSCCVVARKAVEMLKQPGFSGHAMVAPEAPTAICEGRLTATVGCRLVTTGGDASANKSNLNKAYKELIIAAMLYRCGDRDGMAKATLEQYANDVHGHFARYARQALDAKLTVR